MPKLALIDAPYKIEAREDLYMEKDFSYIFEAYYKRVYNFIYYRVNNHYTAEDLTSQIFEKVMLRINTYDESKSPFEVWLFAIARNVTNDYFRSLQNHKFFSIDAIKNLISKKTTPEDIVEIAETNDELLKALGVLNERERNIVALKFGADLKNVEIAKVLDLTESNVGVILFRTMKKLKKELERKGREGINMGKKRIEDRFSIDIDAYLDGIEKLNKPQSEEYNELLELGKTLADKDFSKYSNKQVVFNKTLENINKYKGEGIVKKSTKTKGFATKAASFAIVCILGISLMQTSLAQGVLDKIVRTISLGHITILQTEPSEIKSVPVPDELNGKIFDKDGKPIEALSTEHADKLYTADGEEIAYIDSNNNIVTVAEKEKMREKECLVVKDPNELNNYTCFDVKLPSYLPEGYEFAEAEFYKDENGDVENAKYIGLHFTNEKAGKRIYMQQRFAEEEAGYATGANKVEEIKINGVDAVLYDNSNLDWEANGVIYMLAGRGEITKDELIKIAESIK